MAAVTQETLDTLRRLAEAATPGPYVTDVFTDHEGREVPMLMQGRGLNGHLAYGTHFHDWDQAEADFEFFAAADPSAILALLDALAEVEALRKRAEERSQADHRIASLASADAIRQIKRAE